MSDELYISPNLVVYSNPNSDALGRKPVQVVEIDVDFCANVFGQSPCTATAATGQECFNTFKTCQDPANYSRTTLTLRFVENIYTGIKDQIVFPALQSVSTNPTIIALGNTDENLGSLGKRARVNVKLKDFAWTDVKTDPYVGTRTYNPLLQGTFFGKLRTRWPYYYGRALRVRNGYVGQPLAQYSTRHFIITEWVGPNADGSVTITAQDPLKLADEDLSQAPAASTARLPQGISETFTGSFTFEQSGAGDQYGTTGKASIGSEIVAYTRDGDTITITQRGVGGSEAASHEAGDTFQQCFEVENAKPYDVLLELLRDFAGIPEDQLDLAGWQQQLDTWLSTIRLTRIIPKPVGVVKLLREILNFGIILWWDETAQLVRLKANRPKQFGENVSAISDDADIIEGSARVRDLPKQRYSQVWMWHGLKSYTDSVTSEDNYEKVSVIRDGKAESADEFDQSRALVIYQPWLGLVGRDTTADVTSARILSRYRDTLREFRFECDASRRLDVLPASLIEVSTRLIQDEFGANSPYEMQVTQTEETSAAHRFAITAQTFQFDGNFALIAENDQVDYDAATDAEKEVFGFISDGDNNFPDGRPPYVIS